MAAGRLRMPRAADGAVAGRLAERRRRVWAGLLMGLLTAVLLAGLGAAQPAIAAAQDDTVLPSAPIPPPDAALTVGGVAGGHARDGGRPGRLLGVDGGR